MDDTCVGLGWVVVVLVRKNRHNVGFWAIVMEVLGQRASASVIEFVTEQQDSTPPQADLEQSGHHTLHGIDAVAYCSEHLGSGFHQSCVR